MEGVAAIWMPVQDIERAKGFYRDTLGLPIRYEDEVAPWAVVDANGLTIGLNGREPGGAAAESGLEETVGALQDLGVEVPAGISEHPWGRIATFKDSEGNNVQL